MKRVGSASAVGRGSGLGAGAPHVGQGQVLGVGILQAAGRALPQGSRLLEGLCLPAMVRQDLGNWGWPPPCCRGDGPVVCVPFHHGV